VEAAIGAGTPLVRLARLSPERSLWLKAELVLPSGSAFDRVAGPLLDAAPGDGPAVVAGGGSLAQAFAAAAAVRRRALIVVCPSSTLAEHRRLLEQYPCTLVASASDEGLVGAHALGARIAAERGGRFVYGPRDFSRGAEVFAATLGAELAAQRVEAELMGALAVVAPLGSGLLLEGLVRGLASSAPRPRFVGVCSTGRDSLQDATVPLADAPAVGDVRVEVGDAEAHAMRRRLARAEGLLIGLASAGALAVAVERLEAGTDAASIVLGVDAGDRYFSRDAEIERRSAEAAP
jgi:cysteine synthase